MVSGNTQQVDDDDVEKEPEMAIIQENPDVYILWAKLFSHIGQVSAALEELRDIADELLTLPNKWNRDL